MNFIRVTSRFIGIYIGIVIAIWGFLDAYTYFIDDKLKELLGSYWLLLYGIPLIPALIIALLNSKDERNTEKDNNTLTGYLVGNHIDGEIIGGSINVKNYYASEKPANENRISLQSDLRFVDASLDPLDSPYKQLEEGGSKSIIPKYGKDKQYFEIENIEDSDYDFPTIDFKFQNLGNATAFLWQFGIKVNNVQIDVRPVIDILTIAIHQVLRITVTNSGWGTARDFSARIKEKSLQKVFNKENLVIRRDLLKGQSSIAFVLSRHNAIIHQLEKLIAEEGQTFQSGRTPSLKGVKLNPELVWSCKDEIGNKYNGRSELNLPPTFGQDYYILTKSGFQLIVLSPKGRDARAGSTTTYATLLNPFEEKKEYKYKISRKIPPGDVERFHIMIGATASCNYDVNFIFYVDQDKVLQSDKFNITIWNPHYSWLSRRYEDGAAIDRQINELKRKAISGELDRWDEQKLEKLIKLADLYPFHNFRE